MRDKGTAVLGGAFLLITLLVGFSGGLMLGSDVWKREAVKQKCGYYHHETAEFMWGHPPGTKCPFVK